MFNNSLDKCEGFPTWQITTPTPHAEICPICNGSGAVSSRVTVFAPEGTRDIKESVTCHGCGGYGWITVR